MVFWFVGRRSQMIEHGIQHRIAGQLTDIENVDAMSIAVCDGF